MQRRDFLYALAAAPAVLGRAGHALAAEQAGAELANPYAGVDWNACDYVHSMSHQHQGTTDASRDVFLGMGYRHFAFSNYYPSAPTEVPEAYRTKHPEIAVAPNAEQHSFTDASLHFNGLGSRLATGYGSSLSASARESSPLNHRFENLRVDGADGSGRGVYRLDVTLDSAPGGQSGAAAALTVRGATECGSPRERFADRGPMVNRPLGAGKHVIYLRATASTVETELAYDKAQLTVAGFRLMQGTNRPWRDMFRAALDGEMVDGQQVGGLLFHDGGGITLNHPGLGVAEYAPMLDFDPRVLGIEVWNQHHEFGRGGQRSANPNLHYYQLWDDLLRTGRRCWGFFVKDHLTRGRGRNVLVTAPWGELSAAQRDAAALRAYRSGTFFGSVAALAVDEYGQPAAPYDQSDFRFSRIALQRDADGKAASVQVAVAGNDAAKRPGVQIRFITDQGVALTVDGARAEFPLRRGADGRLAAAFVRVEAFAYPTTHLRGAPLTADMMRKLDVHEISQLHDHRATNGPTDFGRRDDTQPPIPIVDMIFSQPLCRA